MEWCRDLKPRIPIPLIFPMGFYNGVVPGMVCTIHYTALHFEDDRAPLRD